MKFEIETISYLNEDGEIRDGYQKTISDDLLLQAYKIMLQTKRIDERMVTLQRQSIVTFAMPSRGEEASTVVSAAALKPQDWHFYQYREQGAIFMKGFTIQEYCDHMLLNVDDTAKGRQMSNHFGKKELNAVTVSSTLATQIPQAAGCAYAQKLRGEDAVTMCYFAEGAASEGDFHAGLNMAAVTKAPVIFYCRNNHYAISTPSKDQFAGDGIAPRGIGYGMKTYRIDAMDAFAIYDTVQEAREYCAAGNGPVLIEAMAYRIGPHSTADDPSAYRTDDEVAKWEKLCPIERVKKYLIKNNLWSEEQDLEFYNALIEEIEESIAIAKAKPKPGIDSMFNEVYSDIPWNLQEQYDFLKEFTKEESH
ncbi:MAG: thiamine pyrophosphate-dependent dehydrogenase E1 component subunit alpha [Candidatus Cloacimonetes bacterium]|nr:thiamine pyrophosphate-dependent dehydrogenase E1 component subunit alpha [Candidatus Cloacimonadota bacterium]